ncbi:MAG: tetraacyldisaccharide 4'-kinase [Sedimentisphaerales bacterium]|nr:tetraacyldisaccharide 4'-kinase [Sedimentisphaerales bacterium]
MNQDFFYMLVSGSKKGAFAAMLRFCLAAAAQLYAVTIRIRNLLYDKHIFKIHHHEAVVISIGNITLGGTGKTPLVAWLCNFLHHKNLNCVILTRGYKTRIKKNVSKYNITDTATDEPAILAENCPNAKVIINPDRIAGAAEAIEKFAAEILIMDDGFQHRRLARGLDIVTIDATRPFGYEKIFPAGLLREPLSSLKRAHAVVITRCDQVSESDLNTIKTKLHAINPDIVIAKSIHSAAYAKTSENKNIPIQNLKAQKIFAFCGIGNPDAFFKTINALGAELTGSKTFNDHYSYSESDLADIYQQARFAKAGIILTTQKDWTKIRYLDLDKKNVQLAYLAIEIKFLEAEDRLRCLIEDKLESKISKRK